MDESAPPVNFIDNKNRNRFLTYNNSYQLFNIKKNCFYNSSISKNEIHHKSKRKKDKLIIKENKNELKKLQIAIDTEKLEHLEHKNLIELIQLIEFTCDLYLNDLRYVDKTYNIFKIINNKENKRYDIIINNNDKKTKEEKEDYETEEDEEEEGKYNSDEHNNIQKIIQSKNSFSNKNHLKNTINFKTIDLSNSNRHNIIKNRIGKEHYNRNENNRNKINYLMNSFCKN